MVYAVGSIGTVGILTTQFRSLDIGSNYSLLPTDICPESVCLNDSRCASNRRNRSHVSGELGCASNLVFEFLLTFDTFEVRAK